MSKKPQVSMALIGAGRIGQVHLVNLVSNVRVNLTCIIEPEERGKATAEQCGCKYFQTLTEALAYEKQNGELFSAVVICTPTYTHTDLIKQALNADKNVFCEKPIGHDCKTVDSVYDLAKEKGKWMLTGFQRRFDPHFGKVRTAVQAGQVGKLHKVKSISRDNPVPTLEYLKISGGIIHDCASHDLDLVRWTVGKDPIKVFAVGVTHDPNIKALDDYDSVDISLVFPDNVLGSVDVTRKAVYGYDQRLEAVGDAGIANTHNMPTTSFVLGTVDGFKHDPGMYSFNTRYREAYAGELDHFLDLCLGVTDKIAFTATDLHNLTKILDACVESAKTGQVVTVDYS